MLTKEQIENNAKEFMALLDGIDVPWDKEGFSKYIISSDFFIAPASRFYHRAYPGGLCAHSLSVYHELVRLLKLYNLYDQYSESSIRIVSLFHDISKTNFYEKFLRNVKDDQGNWIQIDDYRIADGSKRFTIYDHAVNSFMIVNKFVELSDEESAAICMHMADMDRHGFNSDSSAIFSKYPLASLLHMADFIATYVIERDE